MVLDILSVFLILSGVLLITWCFIGLLVKPIFCADMVSYLPVSGDGAEIELRVYAYAWLREGRISGGKLILLDKGLNEHGTAVAQRLCREYPWLRLEQASGAEL